MSTIKTCNECMKCKYGTLDEKNIKNVRVKCSARGKDYNYGQILECDDFDKKED